MTSPMTSPNLFSPLVIGPVTVPNRVAVAPMCQYMANDGAASDWHIQHLMQLAMSRAGLIVLEATGVERIGRITHHCLGLYTDLNEAALARAMDTARRVATPETKWGIQLAHAGRKASAQRPWEGGAGLTEGQDPWLTAAPSAIAFADNYAVPHALNASGLDRIKTAFCQAAERTARLGFDVIELHAAHGYLLHQFMSPVSNHRTDQYGGSLENRLRFPLEVAKAVRAVMPSHMALGARITGSEWVDNGIDPSEAIAFSNAFQALGGTYVCVTSGGNVSRAKIAVGPNYQVPFASAVKQGTTIVTRAVGMIAEPHQANEIIMSGQADQVALARALLDNPRWVWHAAEKLGATIAYPPQYERAAARLWPGAALARG
jgi:2,4-dienoyl-CoA reductase-like NADH-dependent reductase (Old Yellow Enzyme family)